MAWQESSPAWVASGFLHDEFMNLVVVEAVGYLNPSNWLYNLRSSRSISKFAFDFISSDSSCKQACLTTLNPPPACG